MKPFNFVFALLVCACVGLSFVSSEGNNLLQNQAESPAAAALVSEKSDCDGLEEFMNTELVAEVEAVLKKHDPNVFMTKCYNQVEFEWVMDGEEIASRNGSSKGKLIFNNCGRKVELANVRVDCEKKTFRIRESATSAAQTKAEYLKSFEAYVAKNGIPKDDF